MNTDWNSPQGDFDTAEKQGELLMLLSRQQVTVHTWDDPDFDYMEEQDLALVVQSPTGTEPEMPAPGRIIEQKGRCTECVQRPFLIQFVVS